MEMFFAFDFLFFQITFFFSISNKKNLVFNYYFLKFFYKTKKLRKIFFSFNNGFANKQISKKILYCMQ